MLSLLNVSIGDWAKALLDMLIKVIYLLYASLTAVVDAIQSILRKLVGLDQYWQTSTSSGNIVKTNDPLTEFIYGILGYGESSASYKALNTVFWSLAIFGLIVLIITTMVAIVKSHYNEDSQQTDPWKYIYTAGKSIFTFILLPIVTILGLQITSFILKTLDNIIGGSGSSGEIEAIYGQQALGKFKSADTSSDKETYIYYDYFGTSDPSTTTTFSGTLFNACMYNANRLRIGSGKGDKIVDINLISSSMGGGIFAQSDALNGYASDGEKKERVAYQIDYAFVNNLQLASSISYSTVKSDFEDVVLIVSGLDLSSNSSVNGFSKFNVALVWCFYDLWQFNFIVGFAGVFTTFAIMISIAIGLIGRLFKGAALFLIYPAILGIAPLDNFKAFKSWGTNFIQQVMMAFGSIIGINILLLILPYIQTFQFFEYAILNYMMNVVMLITGLVMAKDFSSIVSGFVGGDDAIAKGDNMKGQVAGAIKSGITAPTRVVGGAARIGMAAATVPIKARRKIKQLGTAVDQMKRRHELNKELKEGKKKSASLDSSIAGTQGEITNLENQNSTLMNNLRNHNTVNQIINSSTGLTKEQEKIKKIGSQAYDEAIKQGLTDKQAKERERNVVLHELGRNSNDSAFKKQYRDTLKAIEGNEKEIDVKKDKVNTDEKEKEKYTKEKIVKKYISSADEALKSGKNISKREYKKLEKEDALRDAAINGNKRVYFDELSGTYKKHSAVADSFKQVFGQIGKRINEGIDGMGLGRTIADSFVKTIEGIGSGLGLDKSIKTLTDELGKSLTFKGGPFKPSLAGDTLQKKQHAELMKQDKEQLSALKDLKHEIVEMRKDLKSNSKKS